MMPLVFRNSREAGHRLAQALPAYANRADVLVVAIARSGVPVGLEVAHTLRTPMDVLVVRKLGVPRYPDIAMGAIAEGGVRVLNETVVRDLGISSGAIDAITNAEQRELERCERQYRRDRPSLDIRGRVVVLVDDGMATGTTMKAAVAALRQKEPARIVVAAVVASRDACREVEPLIDECVCVARPDPFYAIGAWYEEIGRISDQEISASLEDFQTRTAAPATIAG